MALYRHSRDSLQSSGVNRSTVEDAREHFSRARVKGSVPLFIEREAMAGLERPIA